MKRIITYIAAGILVIGANALRAEDTTTSTPPPAHKEATPEQRQAMKDLTKILGLNQKDIKDLEPKERRQKIKEAAEKYVAEHKDKTDLTAEQKSDLEKVQKFLAHGGHKKAKSADSSK